MFPVGIVNIIVLLLVVAVALWAIRAIPGDDTIKNFVRVLIIAIVAIYLIYYLAGLLTSGGLYLPGGRHG